MSEQELAAVVVAWLERAGWDVYQEVQPGRSDGIADIVAVKNEVVLIVECKTSLGLSVIEQALRWEGSAQMIMVAVPERKSLQTQRSWLGELILRDKGLGLFWVGTGFDGKPYVGDEPDILPAWNCRLSKRASYYAPWLDVVCDGHKTSAKAGSSRGGHLTPFKQTMELMGIFVRNHVGCTRKEIAAGIDHHYSDDASFKGAMRVIMTNGWCPGVEERMEGRVYRYYPAKVGQMTHPTEDEK